MTKKVTNAGLSGKPQVASMTIPEKKTQPIQIIEQHPNSDDALSIEIALAKNANPPFVFENGIYIGDTFKEVQVPDLYKSAALPRRYKERFDGNDLCYDTDDQPNLNKMWVGCVISNRVKVTVLIDGSSILKVGGEDDLTPWESEDSAYLKDTTLPNWPRTPYRLRHRRLDMGSFISDDPGKNWIIVNNSSLDLNTVGGKNVVFSTIARDSSFFNVDTYNPEDDRIYRGNVIINSYLANTVLFHGRVNNIDINNSVLDKSSITVNGSRGRVEYVGLSQSSVFATWALIKNTILRDSSINAKTIELLPPGNFKTEAAMELMGQHFFIPNHGIAARSQIEFGTIEMGKMKLNFFSIGKDGDVVDVDFVITTENEYRGVVVNSEMTLMQLQEIVAEALGYKKPSSLPNKSVLSTQTVYNATNSFDNSTMSVMFSLDPVRSSLLNYAVQSLRSRMEIVKMIRALKRL